MKHETPRTASHAAALLSGRLQKGRQMDSRQRLFPDPPVHGGPGAPPSEAPENGGRNPLSDAPGVIVAPRDQLIVNDGRHLPAGSVVFALQDLSDEDLHGVGLSRADVMAAAPHPKVVG